MDGVPGRKQESADAVIDPRPLVFCFQKRRRRFDPVLGRQEQQEEEGIRPRLTRISDHLLICSCGWRAFQARGSKCGRRDQEVFSRTRSDLLTSRLSADGGGKAPRLSPTPEKVSCRRPLTSRLNQAHLSPGVVPDFPRHVVGALHERASDVVIIDRDDDQRKQEVDQEDQERVDLWVHLIGHRVRHAVHEGGVGAVPVALRGDNRAGSRALRR